LQLIQLLVCHLLILDVGAIHLLIPPHYRNEVAPCPNDRTLAEAAESLIRSKVDVLVTVGSPPTRAAKLATATIPIVFVAVGDPVAYGFVSSLARPDANLIGCSGGLAEIGPKGLQFLKEIVPGAKRISILGNPRDPGNDSMVASLQTAASTLGLLLNYLDISQQK
jgi:putative tryptophan/tyrosine transport system substrate-binding protein